MAYIQDKQVTIGRLLTDTFAELASIPRELAVYFAVFAGAALVAEFVSATYVLIAVAAFFGYFVGQYYLYRALLDRAGVAGAPFSKVLGLFGMALILIFPIMIGFNLFYIPGLLLAAKWVMAPSFLVAEDRDLFKALSDSWQASNNNLVALSLSFAILVTAWSVGFIPVFALSTALPGTGFGFGWMVWAYMHVLPVLLMGLSVAAYRALADDDNSLVAVFE